MKRFFVTGTGTDIGKTFVTCCLIEALMNSGKSVVAQKPVISGFDPDNPAGSDTAHMLHALGQPVSEQTMDAVSPWRFREPLSPDMAAAREGRQIDFDTLIEFCRVPVDADVGLIEGVGGIMVPLTASETVLDWMAVLEHPVILVAGSYLGTISHTLTALDVLNRAGLTVEAVVVSESPEQPVPLAETVQTIARFAGDVSVNGWKRAGDPAQSESDAASLALQLGVFG